MLTSTPDWLASMNFVRVPSATGPAFFIATVQHVACWRLRLCKASNCDAAGSCIAKPQILVSSAHPGLQGPHAGHSPSTTWQLYGASTEGHATCMMRLPMHLKGFHVQDCAHHDNSHGLFESQWHLGRCTSVAYENDLAVPSPRLCWTCGRCTGAAWGLSSEQTSSPAVSGCFTPPAGGTARITAHMPSCTLPHAARPRYQP
jgi:hypothetical protein